MTKQVTKSSPYLNRYKAIPEQNLPFLNAWRDKMIERAHYLNIYVPRRETIDWEDLFNEIKTKSLLNRTEFNATLNKLDNNINGNKNNSTIMDGLKKLKKIVIARWER